MSKRTPDYSRYIRLYTDAEAAATRQGREMNQRLLTQTEFETHTQMLKDKYKDLGLHLSDVTKTLVSEQKYEKTEREAKALRNLIGAYERHREETQDERIRMGLEPLEMQKDYSVKAIREGKFGPKDFSKDMWDFINDEYHELKKTKKEKQGAAEWAANEIASAYFGSL